MRSFAFARSERYFGETRDEKRETRDGAGERLKSLRSLVSFPVTKGRQPGWNNGKGYETELNKNTKEKKTEK